MTKDEFEALLDEAREAISNAYQAAPTDNTRDKLSDCLNIIDLLIY